jgi:drug/metabolite transporter (DMT)-like permease
VVGLTLPAGIPSAIGACVLQGIALWSLGFVLVPGDAGPLITSWLLRCEALLLLLLLAAWDVLVARAPRWLTRGADGEQQRPWRHGRAWRTWRRGRLQHMVRRGLLLGLVGLFDAGGLTAYVTGLVSAPTAVVATMASLSVAVVAIVALLAFRERPSAMQWLGLAATLCGVILAAQSPVGAA